MAFAQIHALRVILVESCVLLAAFAFARLAIQRLRPIKPPPWLSWILASHGRAVLLVILAALAGRAALMPILGVPQPRNNNEYSYLLLADTFAHHRITNPTPAAWQHFETLHSNMQPTYHSKFPVSQGLVLAFGQILFHQPWVGVYLSTALLCGAICWALQGFLPPAWALLGGLFAVFRLALFSYWMNSYFGGSVAAFGGAVALGAVVRLFDCHAAARKRLILAVAFALSILVLATSRPYEGLAYSIPLLVYFCYRIATAPSPLRKQLHAAVLSVGAIGLAGILMQGYYNQRTTGDPLLMPYVLNERTYSPLPLFIWQKPNPSLIYRDPVFVEYYKVLDRDDYQPTRSLPSFLRMKFGRFLLDWFFYVGPALSFPVLLGMMSAIKGGRLRLAVYALLAMAIALLMSVHALPHYLAPATVVVYLFAAEGLRYLWDHQGGWERAFVLAVCLSVLVASVTRQTGSSVLFDAYTFPDTRQVVAHQLKEKPGKHMVVVRYLDRHDPQNELAENLADFSTPEILWARSKGDGNDLDLCRAYPDRDFWLLTTDDTNTSLSALGSCELLSQ